MLDLLLAAVVAAAPVSGSVPAAFVPDSPGPAVSGPRALPAAPDTVLALRRGDRVVLENLSGEVTVRSWDRDELELRGEDEEISLMVRRSGSTVRITRDDRKGRRRSVEAALRLPAWVDFVASGRSLDLRVEGIDGRVEVNTVSGDIWVEDIGGPVRIRTIEGEVEVVGARDGVDVSSQSDDVRIRRAVGPISAHSGSGDIDLVDIRSSSVQAETQDGDVSFSGDIADDGDYRFFVHDGDATIAIPSSANARVAVSTFDGEFESEFPVRLDRFTGGREFDFTIGEARARIEIQVFDGEIRLLER